MSTRIWDWRQTIARALLEPNTKLVLYTLANYMNEQGGSCYPTIDMIADDSCLSRRAVINHLEKASEAGFIIKSKHGFKGQRWANNEYKATFPEQVKDSAPDAPPYEEKEVKGRAGYSANSNAEGSAPDALDKGKVVHLTTEGSASNDKKVVHQMHTNSPYNSPITVHRENPTTTTSAVSARGMGFNAKDIFSECEKLYTAIPDFNAEWHLMKKWFEEKEQKPTNRAIYGWLNRKHQEYLEKKPPEPVPKRKKLNLCDPADMKILEEKYDIRTD